MCKLLRIQIAIYLLLTSLSTDAGTLYMPEGYVGDKVDEYITVLNTSDKVAKGAATIYYEDGTKQEIAVSFPPKQRSGITLKGTVKANLPFSTVLQTDMDITASLIHYDNGSALGADFSQVLSNTWSIAEGYKSDTVRDYLSIFNPSDKTIEVKMSLTGGGNGYDLNQFTLKIEKQRRFSVSLHDFVKQSLSQWTTAYGIILEAPEPIVASLSHYDSTLKDGMLLMGHPNKGESEGVIAEGWISSTGFEYINLLYPMQTDNNFGGAEVSLTAVYNEGGIAQEVTNQGLYFNQRLGILLNSYLPKDKPFALKYNASSNIWDQNTQRYIKTPTNVVADFVHYDKNGLNGVSFSNSPSKHWEFSEGYYNDAKPNQVQEFLLVYNPNLEDANVKVTVFYDDGKDPTVLSLLVKGKTKDGLALHVHDTKVNLRKRTDGGIWYGTMIESDQPVIPYFTHYDTFFGGSFALNGTPRR